ncbi:odorant receptor 4-like [Venturia canescens]|uniref:odorant receptor 4-like n=1 Tax=Venturia canescens TaxID=32260 RepID=UPI001C9BEC47|nr:odorant receptor 4-like [Venturia canescens]
MEKQLQRYESYACGVKRLLLLAGLWPGRVSSKLFQLVVVTHFTSSVITACGIMYFVVSHITNLDLVTKGLGIAVSFYTILLKVIVFTINRSSLVELHETLEKNFRKDLKSPEYQSVLLSPIANFNRPTLYLTLSTLGVFTMYNITPIVGIIIQLSHGTGIIKRPKLFPSKYPFVESNGIFATRYLIEMWASFAIGSITAATDALFGFYIFQMSSQLRVLSYRMNKLTAADDHQTIIKECVVRRQFLAQCRDKLQTIYGPIILWMLTTSAMTMCANIFQASQISMDKAVLVFVYISMKLMQTLLYGWFGLFLTTESEAFRDSIYSCGWPGCGDKLFISYIKTMLLCRPLVLKALQFYSISVDMFMAIMNTTISYFFLLRTLDEK